MLWPVMHDIMTKLNFSTIFSEKNLD